MLNAGEQGIVLTEIVVGLLVTAVITRWLGGATAFWEQFGIYGLAATAGALLFIFVALVSIDLYRDLLNSLLRLQRDLISYMGSRMVINIYDRCLDYIIFGTIVYSGMAAASFVVWRSRRGNKR